MRIYPPVTVGTTAFVFDPAPPNGGRRLKYLRIKSATGGQTMYMGNIPDQNTVDITHVILDDGVTRIKLSDYELLLNSGTDPDNTAGQYIQPGWVITGGTDIGVVVKRVYDGFVEFASGLSAYADDFITLSPPFYAATTNGFPIVAGDSIEITDLDILRGPISFATASGSATLNLLFELT